jgi:hypothetical protein
MAERLILFAFRAFSFVAFWGGVIWFAHEVGWKATVALALIAVGTIVEYALNKHKA